MLRRCWKLAALLVAAPGCFDWSSLDTIFCKPGEPCNVGVVCGDQDQGLCPDPLLAYDPGVTNFGAEFPAGEKADDTIVGRLEPFAEDTVCHTVVLGLNINTGPCEYSGPVDVVVLHEVDGIPRVDPMVEIVQPDLTEFTSIADQMIEIRLPLDTEHACGEYPFVGVKTNGVICPLLHPATCDGSKGWRFDGDSWGPVASSEQVQVYAGLDDCEPL